MNWSARYASEKNAGVGSEIFNVLNTPFTTSWGHALWPNGPKSMAMDIQRLTRNPQQTMSTSRVYKTYLQYGLDKALGRYKGTTNCLGCGSLINKQGQDNHEGYCGADCLVSHLNRIEDGVEDK
jgi:hypothetical protein